MVFDRHFFQMKWKIRWKKTVYSSLAPLPIELCIMLPTWEIYTPTRKRAPFGGIVQGTLVNSSKLPSEYYYVPNTLGTRNSACAKETRCHSKRIVCRFYNQIFNKHLLCSLSSHYSNSPWLQGCLMCEQNTIDVGCWCGREWFKKAGLDIRTIALLITCYYPTQ